MALHRPSNARWGKYIRLLQEEPREARPLTVNYDATMGEDGGFVISNRSTSTVFHRVTFSIASNGIQSSYHQARRVLVAERDLHPGETINSPITDDEPSETGRFADYVLGNDSLWRTDRDGDYRRMVPAAETLLMMGEPDAHTPPPTPRAASRPLITPRLQRTHPPG